MDDARVAGCVEDVESTDGEVDGEVDDAGGEVDTEVAVSSRPMS